MRNLNVEPSLKILWLMVLKALKTNVHNFHLVGLSKITGKVVINIIVIIIVTLYIYLT
jgi:hypothetical protein